jgi:hypothetical protein
MKLFKPIIIAAATCCMLASCGNEAGRSTSIDSTNNNGIAPAQYSEGAPETRIDTSIKQHDAKMRDSVAGTQNTSANPVGTGTNTSNTTDKTTTSGSANHGDADKDRKK